MKYTLSFLLFLLAAATVTVPAAGQHADARIGALLNSGDYFTLREVLPRQADSIASPVVRGWPKHWSAPSSTGRPMPSQPYRNCWRHTATNSGPTMRRAWSSWPCSTSSCSTGTPLRRNSRTTSLPIQTAVCLTNCFLASNFSGARGTPWPDVRPRSSSCPKAAPAYPTGSTA